MQQVLRNDIFSLGNFRLIVAFGSEIPEKIFFDVGKEQKKPINSLEGTLVEIDFFGIYTRYKIQLTDGAFFKLSLHHRKAKQHKHLIGDSVRVLFAISDVFQIHEK